MDKQELIKMIRGAGYVTFGEGVDTKDVSLTHDQVERLANRILAAEDKSWVCKECGQTNSGWATSCGRCNTTKEKAILTVQEGKPITKEQYEHLYNSFGSEFTKRKIEEAIEDILNQRDGYVYAKDIINWLDKKLRR